MMESLLKNLSQTDCKSNAFRTIACGLQFLENVPENVRKLLCKKLKNFKEFNELNSFSDLGTKLSNRK